MYEVSKAAMTPPMGWNSWDCYGAAVNEEQLRGNAEYMAKYMREFGWEYIVCDIQWYEPAAKSTEYNAFYPLCMDQYSRLIPAENRFPSAREGKGFAPIAAYIHGLGLKFGIHIMRGVPRQAVHAATPILGSNLTARDIAHPFSLCSWNTDMYGINPECEGAQAYYDSLFRMYADWGVDFVKVDDICNTEFKPHDPYSARREIEMIRTAINRSGRKMVLSLSPGPAVLAEAGHLRENANMWRITGDFWDNWFQLESMFERCNAWSPYVGEGHWPDCDMLPLGRIGVNTPGHDATSRYTGFTHAEQVTMMTLWCIFRSPLMVGAELRENDEFTLSLLTNPEVLALLSRSREARQLLRTADTVIWAARDAEGGYFLAFFNLSYNGTCPKLPLERLGFKGACRVRNLWERRDLGEFRNFISAEVPAHGAVLYRITEN